MSGLHSTNTAPGCFACWWMRTWRRLMGQTTIQTAAGPFETEAGVRVPGGASVSFGSLGPIMVGTSPGEDRPRWKRQYVATIGEACGRACTLTIDAKSYSPGWRSYHGQLRQHDGDRSVWFDPERPADKILDRDLLPDVEAVCRAAMAADTVFMATERNTFTDEDGVIWQRVQG